MPKKLTFNEQIDRAVARGKQVALEANTLRARHRRSTPKKDPQRRKQLAHQQQAVDAAMKPIRSLIGKLPWHDATETRIEALYAASKALQYERRQLKKMRGVG